MGGMRLSTFSSSSGLHAGFTLVEQVVTLAIAAILIAMAVPAMAGLIARSAVRDAEDALFTAAQLARSSAVNHDVRALLCPSSDGRHCNGRPSWQQGWIVGLDRDRDGQPDTVALVHRPPGPRIRIIGSAGRDRVRFKPDGSAAGTNLTLLICPHGTRGETARAVIVSNVGRIRETRADPEQAARCDSASKK